ncbi:DUF5615 family PIN-like protein [Candidatus Sumerlaeota bacterium]|nr:DUF5615 family PIN-like protein [Candidatus Sumerlaeota bacterium]MBI3736560.1 DUF5615 family PIN-like protein [Candidatus Sumerlaeota bacterium]
MRILADESCAYDFVRILRAAGHQVTAVCESAAGISDEQVMDFALRKGTLLLTEDKDFGQMVFAAKKKSNGVILLRYPSQTIESVSKDLEHLLRIKQGALLGNFTVIQPGKIRITPIEE